MIQHRIDATDSEIDRLVYNPIGRQIQKLRL